MASSTLIPRGFLLAGCVNIFGILFFGLGFSNAYLSELSPEVFSPFGQIGIILWGLAFVAVAKSYRETKWIVAVFMVEKLVYGGTWILWMIRHSSELSRIFETSPLTGTFYVIYGPLDLFFGLFFGWVIFRTNAQKG